jgi:predicted Ser/Thr protein kinase
VVVFQLRGEKMLKFKYAVMLSDGRIVARSNDKEWLSKNWLTEELKKFNPRIIETRS